jgi:hypothetical protein
MPQTPRRSHDGAAGYHPGDTTTCFLLRRSWYAIIQRRHEMVARGSFHVQLNEWPAQVRFFTQNLMMIERSRVVTYCVPIVGSNDSTCLYEMHPLHTDSRAQTALAIKAAPAAWTQGARPI